VYKDAASIAAHRDTPHFKEIIEGIIVPLLEKREREIYTQLIG
jgi:quinol monooxygenase YgiN